jgi:uncharacterized protein (TIGR02246 family)
MKLRTASTVSASLLLTVLLAAQATGSQRAAAPAKPVMPAKIEDSYTGLSPAGRAFVAAWNSHDAAALAALWHEDGDLINPAGRVAKGRAQIETLFRDEQSTLMRSTTLALRELAVHHSDPNVRFEDWDVEITGMQGPEGLLPLAKVLFFRVLTRQKGEWRLASARACAFHRPAARAKE